MFIHAACASAYSYQFISEHDGGVDYIDADTVRPLGINTQFNMATVFTPPQNLGFTQPVKAIITPTALDCKKVAYFSGVMYAYNEKQELITKTTINKWFAISPTSTMERIFNRYCK